jgi:hypothetical protein
MSAARDKGTRAETALVAELLKSWPYAERRALHGNQDRGDIAGTPGICWEVKSYLDLGRAISEGLSEAEKEARDGELAVTVARRRNKPAGLWYATVAVQDLVKLYWAGDTTDSDKLKLSNGAPGDGRGI